MGQRRVPFWEGVGIMFDVGFSEMLLIAFLALIVLGPDKLPELGQKLGGFFRSYQQSKRDIQSTLFSAPTVTTNKPSHDNDTKQNS